MELQQEEMRPRASASPPAAGGTSSIAVSAAVAAAVAACALAVALAAGQDFVASAMDLRAAFKGIAQLAAVISLIKVGIDMVQSTVRASAPEESADARKVATKLPPLSATHAQQQKQQQSTISAEAEPTLDVLAALAAEAEAEAKAASGTRAPALDPLESMIQQEYEDFINKEYESFVNSIFVGEE
eukprot:TRINITY_DN56438_c0_g1_i1.p1 TRINITY_DN56438_c0_g1~~TRINITY_DN56438_c0_g1_i1.p1  ORF type:complete len:186 (+),score=62.73 TRINITY_DN56438_c0_g1_i1:176-733(+)